MAGENKKQTKVPFSEEDAASLVQKYDAQTVLTMLQELANHPHSKFDWEELVAKTATGISSAREYQMLWRHIAYGHSLTEFDSEDAPLDDDSDLECEREALPPVNKEAAAEAAACVQVMISSFKLDQCTPSTSVIQAPLIINVPILDSTAIAKESSQSSNLKTQEKEIIFPVTVKRQTLPNISSTRTAETGGGSISGDTSIKKKRAAWSEEEDMQLRAAVQKWGEGNWAHMAKRDDFPIKRSTSQLSKRWSTLRKKEDGTN
ncbi:hypothetical protein Fmac_031495 [Flemingia macrophylla]|uniref:Uncharacterized protein n=1 Tax=Flemingia macrophylla TaxID=520843 RepID=A0ABD1L287_9FABA